MLTIAQITDLHITVGRNPEVERRNVARLRQVLAAIHDRHPRPLAIIASGDLVDAGSPEEYAALAAIFAEVEIPLFLATGNHDRRAPLLAAFPAPFTAVDDDGFIQYVVVIDDLRVIVCDTLDEGRDGGAFCERRAAWLARTLDEAPEAPTVVVLHHPPIPSGIQWMDPEPGATWIGRLEAVLAGRPRVLTTVCGHVHRAYHGAFAGGIVAVSPATSLQLTLDLTPIDLRVPDGRQILLGEPPGYTLLAWDGARLTTHVCVAGTFGDEVTYDKAFSID
jgi:3',5'-cyclic AMP phosphodiesterase CpdA